MKDCLFKPEISSYIEIEEKLEVKGVESFIARQEAAKIEKKRKELAFAGKSPQRIKEITKSMKPKKKSINKPVKKFEKKTENEYEKAQRRIHNEIQEIFD